MRFMDAYKRLERLCRDTMRDEKPIKAYIEEMKRCFRGAYLVEGWEEDLRQLKHYHWVRNQISHEPGCSEETMCEEADALWLEDFYTRIMHQTDPLSMYRKVINTPSQPVARRPYSQPTAQKPTTRTTMPEMDARKQKENVSVGCLGVLLCVLIAALIGEIWFFFLR